MIDALSATEAGMLNDVQRMQVVSHNLANAATVGYKRDVAVARPFFDYLNAAGQARANAPGMDVYTAHTAGSVKSTGNPLDLALEGDGFFAVATAVGDAYTRQGNFRIDASGRLVTTAGDAVLGEHGEIRLTGGNPRIDTEGRVWEGETQVGQLQRVTIDNPSSLLRQGAYYMPTETSQLAAATSVRVRQGYQEMPNVTAMHEMVTMIETMRHFETSQRVAHAYDAMLDRAINIVGEL